jgi:hypothetical protein
MASAGGLATGAVGDAAVTRRRVAAVFFVHGLLFASWVAHIPHVESLLSLDDAGLGLALLGAPIGSVVGIVAVARLLSRVGSRGAIVPLLGGYAVAGLLAAVARSPLALALGLGAWGACQGALDVSMNTQGVTVERALGRPIMSGLHGAWSLGSFCGAGVGALAVALGVSLTDQLLVLGPLVALAVAAMPGRFLADGPPAPELAAGPERAAGLERAAHERPAVRDVLRRPFVLLLGAIACAVMLCEGAAADWSAVDLRTAAGAAPAVAGLGYAAFAAAMCALRLGGDRLLARRRARAVLPPLAALATAGMAVALLAPTPATVLIGLATLGAGCGLVVPATFSAAGRLPDLPAGIGIATVSGIGWVGFVGGPPLIGRLAGAASLPVALGIVPLLMAVVAGAVRVTRAYDGVAIV